MASICILDCEMFYETSPVPNITAMKLSSFHKQRDDSVLILQPGDKLKGKYDLIYVIREHMSTPYPPMYIYDMKNIKLLGKSFKGQDGYIELQPYIMSVRPDYDLYKKNNIFCEADYVVYSYGFYKIDKMQDFHRSTVFSNKKRLLIVADENLWAFKDDFILEVLNKLQEEEAIYFQHPVRLSRLVSNITLQQAFFKLKFTKKLKINYINDLGNSYENAKKIIDFLYNFKQVKKFVNISPPGFKIVTKDHWKVSESAIVDFENCLKILAYANQKNVRISFQYPTNRLATPVWNYFEFFRTWSRHYHKLSYVEALLKHTCAKFDVKEYELINNTLYWKSNGKLQQLIHLLTTYPDLMRDYAFENWEHTNKIYNKIDFEYINKHKNDFNYLQ